MAIAKLTFPVEDGIHGMDRLARRLNEAGLAGDWHFAAGTRFDQGLVEVRFDAPEDPKIRNLEIQNPAKGFSDTGGTAAAASAALSDILGALAPIAVALTPLRGALDRAFGFFEGLARR